MGGIIREKQDLSHTQITIFLIVEVVTFVILGLGRNKIYHISCTGKHFGKDFSEKDKIYYLAREEIRFIPLSQRGRHLSLCHGNKDKAYCFVIGKSFIISSWEK